MDFIKQLKDRALTKNNNNTNLVHEVDPQIGNNKLC